MLVVEDDSPIRAVHTDLLHDAGYAVVEAVNGYQALEHLHEERPDLIVLDLMLPGMSGWEFLERSREQLETANIPVIVLSAIRGGGDYPTTLGVAAWYTKPLDVDRFLGAVQRLAGPPQPPSVPGRGSDAVQQRVLVVDDDPRVCSLLAEHFEDEGYAVEVAHTIAAARQQLADHRPDLILLDPMLPDQTGWDFLRARAAEPDMDRVPVLVISAAPEERLLEAKHLGADGFLSKPFDVDVLSALAQTLTRAQR